MLNKKLFILVAALLFSGVRQLPGQTLSLDEAINLARANNPELKASQLEIEKARQQKTIARSLLLPTITANAQANHFFQLQPFFGFGETSENGKIPYGRFGGDDQLTTFITGVQPIYNAQAYPSLQKAQLQQKHSIVSAWKKQVDLLSEIKLNYLQIVILNERIQLTQESISRNKLVLRDAKSLFLQGKALRVDTLRAYTSVKNLEPDLVKLSFAVETAKLNLKALIGLDAWGDLQLSDSLKVPSVNVMEDEQSVYVDVLKNNPEFQLLKLQEQLDRQNTKLASSYRKPVLSLIGQYQLQSQTNNFEYNNAYYPSSSFVGLQLAVPIFTGLSTQARIKHASITEKQASLKLTSTQAQLRAKVHQSIANVKEASLRLENTAIVQETAQVSYNIIQFRYKNGIASRIELTDAELALSTAQSNYLEALYDYVAARIELNKIRGSVE
jgi:outer membrane protein TolC